MNIRIDVFSVVLFLGVIQGIFLSFVFFTKGVRSGRHHRLLGWIVAAFTAQLMEVFLCYTGLIVFVIHYYDASEPANFLLPPLIYLYFAVSKNLAPRRNQYLHFVPFVLYLAYSCLFFVQTGAYKYDSFLWAYHPDIAQVGVEAIVPEDPLLLKKNVNPIALTYALIYLFLTLRILINHQIPNSGSGDAPKSRNGLWLQNFLILYTLNILFWAYRTIFVIRDLADHISAAFDAALIYYMSYLMMKDSSFFEPVVIKTRRKYEKSTLQEARIEAIAKKVKQKLEEEELFLDPNLTIKSLAEQIPCHPHYLSQVLNRRFGQNFFHLLAHYRIEKARKLLADPTYHDVNISEIAEMVGYYSRSAFNRAFKERTGRTPSQFKKESRH